MKAVLILLVVAITAVAAKNVQSTLENSNVETKCAIAAQGCKKPTDCCGGLTCNQLTKKCERVCTKAGDACKTAEDCCSSTCTDGICLCFSHGATCTWGDECCDGSCSAQKGCCRKSGTDCDTHGQCCSGICQLPAASAPNPPPAPTPGVATTGHDCHDDEKKDAAKKPAGGKAGDAKKAADGKAKADAPAKKAEKKAAAPAKKAAPASKQCCSDFGQKCADGEPCCPPYICSDLLGMCTLKVKID